MHHLFYPTCFCLPYFLDFFFLMNFNQVLAFWLQMEPLKPPAARWIDRSSRVWREWQSQEARWTHFYPLLPFHRWPNSAACSSPLRGRPNAAWWITTVLPSRWRVAVSELPSSRTPPPAGALSAPLPFPLPSPSQIPLAKNLRAHIGSIKMTLTQHSLGRRRRDEAWFIS